MTRSCSERDLLQPQWESEQSHAPLDASGRIRIDNINVMRYGVREIKLKLWRHDADDWSIEVHGRLHSHISSVMVDELVEYALVAAQQELELEQSTPCALSLVAIDGQVN